MKALSGTNEVPVLVLDDGTVISDSRRSSSGRKSTLALRPEHARSTIAGVPSRGDRVTLRRTIG